MTVYVIITLCILLLIAYLFDISAKYTRIPSVILLLILGWSLKQLTDLTSLNIPNLNIILPGLGSIGLIMIVLEGALELEVKRNDLRKIGNTFLMAVLPMLILAGAMAWLFMAGYNCSFSDAMVNTIPIAVISSAIAIPSARNLSASNREFIVYESSFSDITGVLMFNFMVANTEITTSSFTDFFLAILLMLLIAFIATVILSFLMNRIRHHIKFVPIILLLILVYESTKLYHLPGLLFILIFGVFVSNIGRLTKFRIISRLKPEKLTAEVHKFRDIVVEGTFLVRASFFTLFGYLISTKEVLNKDTILLALIIFFSIVFLRLISLLAFRLPVFPLLFIAPRGLITILLFLSIPAGRYVPLINNSLVIQVILLTSFFMMIGLLFIGQKQKKAAVQTEQDVQHV